MVSFVLWEHEAQVRFLPPRPVRKVGREVDCSGLLNRRPAKAGPWVRIPYFPPSSVFQDGPKVSQQTVNLFIR